MSSPRICVITTSYPRREDDDASVFVKRLVDALALQGACGAVLVPDGGHKPVDGGPNGFSLVPVSYGTTALTSSGGALPTLRRKPWLLFFIPMLMRALSREALRRSESFDVLLSQWLPAAWAAARCARKTGKPWVATVMGSDRLLLSVPLLGQFLCRALRSAQWIVYENEEIGALLRARAPTIASRLTMNPFGIDLNLVEQASAATFAALHKLPQDRAYAAFVGRIVPAKGVHLLIEALPKIPQLELLLCGRLDDASYEAELRAQTQRLGLGSRVHYLGSVAPAEVFGVYKLAKVYLSASETEGRPNAVLEALAARCPVVLSDIPGHRELVASGERGVLFSDAAELALRVNELLGDEQGRARKVAAGYEFAAGRTWAETARRYLQLLG